MCPPDNTLRPLPTWPGLLLAGLLLAWPAAAQVAPEPAAEPTAPTDALALTLDEAIQIALVNNYTLQNTRLDVDNASAQVREAWGQVLPQVSASSSYTRNLKTANPFAGSQAGGLFQSFGFIDWLSYNEQARTDSDPSTMPIPFGEFQDRQQQGLNEAGIVLDANDNPFAVDNQFQNQLSITQTLYNGSAFAAIRGAERLKEINRQGVNRQEQLIIDEVRAAYYQALLAQAQAQTFGQSVDRTGATLREVSLQVQQGVAPKFQRLTAEVQLANLETQLLQAENAAALALESLKFTLAIPAEQPIVLRSTLNVEEPGAFMTVSVDDAMAVAMDQRPDLKQAELAVALREVDRNLTRAQYYPTVAAFANLGLAGQVPDNRTFTITDPDDPFAFSEGQSDFFSSSYWNPSVNVGLRLSWNIFSGFQTRARVQQRSIAIDKAEVERNQLIQAVRLDVEQALRNLNTARQQLATQDLNVQRAEVNYEYASARLREGVASPLVEREASDLLDQSRLNYVQAMHDYLRARSAFQTAIGQPLLTETDGLQLTSN